MGLIHLRFAATICKFSELESLIQTGRLQSVGESNFYSSTAINEQLCKAIRLSTSMRLTVFPKILLSTRPATLESFLVRKGSMRQRRRSSSGLGLLGRVGRRSRRRR